MNIYIKFGQNPSTRSGLTAVRVFERVWSDRGQFTIRRVTDRKGHISVIETTFIRHQTVDTR